MIQYDSGVARVGCDGSGCTEELAFDGDLQPGKLYPLIRQKGWKISQDCGVAAYYCPKCHWRDDHAE